MEQQKLPIWNNFDEFGLQVGLGHWTQDGRELRFVRYPGETNEQLKERILQVYKYKSNSTKQGLVNSLSRDFLTKRYNIETQYHYFLTQEPYAQLSGIHVYSSGTNNSWTEIKGQVRASGYPIATTGWIVWNDNDTVLPDGTMSYGSYSQVLEFIGTTLPDNDIPIKIEYQIVDHYDEQGAPVLNWFTDMDNSNILDSDEMKFKIKKAETPNPSSQIVIHQMNDLANSDAGFSGVFYTHESAAQSKLVEIGNYFNRKHPIEWGKIPWDTIPWENADNLSQGTLPSLFDAELPVNNSGELESDKFLGGVKQGENLYMMGIQVEERGSNSGAYAFWYPILYPGEFYISNTGYYLFENKQSWNALFDNNSGAMPTSNPPKREQVFILGSSGNYGLSGNYISELHRYPYGSGRNFESSQIYRRRYDFKDRTNTTNKINNGEYYINFYDKLISGVNLSGQVEAVWEHPDASGLGKICSGIDLNIYNNSRETSILFFG